MSPPVIVFGMNSMFAVRQFLTEILELMHRRGYRVVVLAPGGEPHPGIAGIEHRHIPLRREISPWRDLRALAAIFRILRDLRPTVCNMSTPKMALIGGIAAWLAGVPHRIYTLRGLRYETTRFARRMLLMLCEKVACACAHEVICISRSVRDRAIRDGIAPPRKTVLLGERVSEGLSPARLPIRHCGPARRELGIPENAFVMGFVGRLTRDKGIGELVEAFRILHTVNREVRLLLAGGFEAGDRVPAVAETSIRTDPRIHWVGPVPDAAPFYALMDVFVFPTHREGLGRVLLEAGAAAKPVVATRTTGVVDVVRDGVTGLLVPPRDSGALARAVKTILDDPERGRLMGQRAQTLVREEFDNSAYLSRLAVRLEQRARPLPAKAISLSSRSISR